MYHCSICCNTNLGTGWFCKKCIEEYSLTDKKSNDWPDWIRACVSFERKDRHLTKLEQEFDVINYGLLDDLPQETIS